ncbi:MAG: radical SAM family heme chaperone HemW [Gammaproteobacteria bacterium]|nr:radical SAM family heme chaperone HemW [Gammaproteobacteria bacterium]
MRVPFPLTLYIHLPWCVQKCPYCDFNSHPVRNTLPEKAYIQALLEDLETDYPKVEGRMIHSVFIGGGTPSLFSPSAIACLLEHIKRIFTVQEESEITLEANPGTLDESRFSEFRQAGVNRLSIGVQSFEEEQLKKLGRIHGRLDAIRAVEEARRDGFSNINIDLMYGLPGQSTRDAVSDIRQALSLSPTHISWYELTLEPNTFFYRHPPVLPAEGVLENSEQAGFSEFSKNGFVRYEISAYSKPGFFCQHNLNYWQFGDYLGIGAGAHSKLSFSEEGARVVHRISKIRHPTLYMRQRKKIAQEERLTDLQKATEFMMNGLRLIQGVSIQDFEERTGLSYKYIEKSLSQAIERGLIKPDKKWICPTLRGHRYLNELLALFD